MRSFLLIDRLALAAVFLVAGLAKLVDRSRPAAVRELGIPAPLARPVAVILPVVELGVVAALVPARSAWIASVAALGLLVAFVVVIVANLVRGRRPSCRCFGQVHAEPIGWASVARNGLLAALAGAVVVQGPGRSGATVAEGLAAGRHFAVAAVAGLVVVAAAEGWLILHLLARTGRLLVRLDALEGAGRVAGSGATSGLAVGTEAPDFTLVTDAGAPISRASLLSAGAPLLLVFTDPACAACRELVPEIAQAARDNEGTLTVAFHARRGDAPGTAGHGRLLVEPDGRLAEAFGAVATPSAVVVGPGGRVASALAEGPAAVRALVAGLVGSAPPVVRGKRWDAVPLIGQPAGATAVPEELRGREVLLIFWDPSCAFCQQLVPELRAWEAAPPACAPALRFVSSGSAEEHQAMGLRSTLVTDEGSRLASSFGADATPMALVVDAEGRVASGLVAGAPAVMALARSRCAPAGQADRGSPTASVGSIP